MNTSRLTKEALAKLKAKGVKLGNPRISEAQAAGKKAQAAYAAAYRTQMLPIIHELQQDGVRTLQELADALNRRGYTARRGGPFHPSTVRRIIQNSYAKCG